VDGRRRCFRVPCVVSLRCGKSICVALFVTSLIFAAKDLFVSIAHAQEPIPSAADEGRSIHRAQTSTKENAGNQFACKAEFGPSHYFDWVRFAAAGARSEGPYLNEDNYPKELLIFGFRAALFADPDLSDACKRRFMITFLYDLQRRINSSQMGVFDIPKTDIAGRQWYLMFRENGIRASFIHRELIKRFESQPPR
jgi:hypothetical protein